MSFEVKDSGQREAFHTGSRRDTRVGKGRYDLLNPIVLERDAKLLEGGAIKYGERNNELGQPMSRYADSALRHLWKFLEGHRDEDHLAAVRWNVGNLIYVEEGVKRGYLPASLADMPNFITGEHLAKVAAQVDDRAFQSPTREAMAAGHALDEAEPETVAIDHRKIEAAARATPGAVWGSDGTALQTFPFSVSDAEKKHKPTIYIAGPMRGKPGLNFQAFDDAAEKLRLRGWRVISPAEIDRAAGTTEQEVNAASLDKDADAKFRRTLVRRDTDALLDMKAEKGDAIFLLNGWPDSVGAMAESGIARWLGLKMAQECDGYPAP